MGGEPVPRAARHQPRGHAGGSVLVVGGASLRPCRRFGRRRVGAGAETGLVGTPFPLALRGRLALLRQRQGVRALSRRCAGRSLRLRRPVRGDRLSLREAGLLRGRRRMADDRAASHGHCGVRKAQGRRAATHLRGGERRGDVEFRGRERLCGDHADVRRRLRGLAAEREQLQPADLGETGPGERFTAIASVCAVDELSFFFVTEFNGDTFGVLAEVRAQVARKRGNEALECLQRASAQLPYLVYKYGVSLPERMQFNIEGEFVLRKLASWIFFLVVVLVLVLVATWKGYGVWWRRSRSFTSRRFQMK